MAIIGTIVPDFLKIPEAVRLSGLSRSGLYRHMGTGRIKAVKDGRRTLIERASLEQYMAQLPVFETAR